MQSAGRTVGSISLTMALVPTAEEAHHGKHQHSTSSVKRPQPPPSESPDVHDVHAGGLTFSS